MVPDDGNPYATVEPVTGMDANDAALRSSRRRAAERTTRVAFRALLCATATIGRSFADTTATEIPAGTRVQFHLTEPMSSNGSKAGQTFDFVLLAPVTAGDVPIPAYDTTGTGTILVAGHAGSSGHEGDLTLRLDSLRTPDGHVVTFTNQRFEMNGRNRKIASGVLGFVPYVGLASYFIRGSEVRVDTSTPIETVLLHPAQLTAPGETMPSPKPTST